MTNKHIQRKWNEYFESEVDKGMSKAQIRKDLVERGVSNEYIELKLRNYQKTRMSRELCTRELLQLLLQLLC